MHLINPLVHIEPSKHIKVVILKIFLKCNYVILFFSLDFLMHPPLHRNSPHLKSKFSDPTQQIFFLKYLPPPISFFCRGGGGSPVTHRDAYGFKTFSSFKYQNHLRQFGVFFEMTTGSLSFK